MILVIVRTWRARWWIQPVQKSKIISWYRDEIRTSSSSDVLLFESALGKSAPSWQPSENLSGAVTNIVSIRLLTCSFERPSVSAKRWKPFRFCRNGWENVSESGNHKVLQEPYLTNLSCSPALWGNGPTRRRLEANNLMTLTLSPPTRAAIGGRGVGDYLPDWPSPYNGTKMTYWKTNEWHGLMVLQLWILWNSVECKKFNQEVDKHIIWEKA